MDKGREGNLFDEMYEKLRRSDRPASPVFPHTPKEVRDKKRKERLRKYKEQKMIPDDAGDIGTQDIKLEAFNMKSEEGDNEEEEEEIRRIAKELRNTERLIATSIGYTLTS